MFRYVIFLFALSFASAHVYANDKASLVLDWRIGGDHGGFYLAKERGYFSEQGIDIEITSGSGSAKNIAILAAGSATFALVDGTNLVNGVAKGMPIKFVAANSNLSAYAVCVREDRHLSGINDLVGKKIVSTAGTSLTTFFPVVLKANGIDPSDVTMIYQDPATAFTSVAQGRVDGILSGIHDQPLRLEDQGIPMKCSTFTDLGLPAIGKGIAVNTATIAKNPDLIRRFLVAVRKGFEAAIADPDAGAKAAWNAEDPVMRTDLWKMKRHLEISLTLMAPGEPGKSFLTLNRQILSKQIDILKQYQGLITDKTIEDFYTSEFLPSTDQ